jgi:hypothetical protein
MVTAWVNWKIRSFLCLRSCYYAKNKPWPEITSGHGSSFSL